MADLSPVALLRAHARHAPWNARGLAAHATALVDAAAMRPTNAAARASLSARAIRFYVANGLLDQLAVLVAQERHGHLTTTPKSRHRQTYRRPH